FLWISSDCGPSRLGLNVVWISAALTRTERPSRSICPRSYFAVARFRLGPIFVECQQPAFLTPLELRVEDFEGKFTDTATNTPVAVIHEKVNVLVRVVVVSGIKG